MPDSIGPHLLGRRPNVPDDRDWDAHKLHAHLREIGTFNPTQTIEQATVNATSWRDILALASAIWAWLKHKKPPAPPPPVEIFTLWADAVVLDQGDYGTCVGNAGAGWLASQPVVDPGVNETLARALYREATCFDGQCDDTYQAGSTSRSLAKALQARGRLSAYAFASTMADVDEWLDHHGPVCVGTDWTNDMFDPDASGYVHPTGSVAGGHEYLVLGRESADVYRLRNSWGTGWGLSGDFRMVRSDLTKLLFQMDGDALLTAELPL